MTAVKRKRVTIEAFIEGDVYIDYPYEEDVKFRFEKETGKVYQRWYRGSEMEISGDSELYHESHSGGQAITREEYFLDQGSPDSQPPIPDDTPPNTSLSER